MILDLTSNFHIEDISFVVNRLYLKELHIEHCINMDDEIATRVLSSVNNLQALETLNLRMCIQFDSEQLISIGLSHHSLRLYKHQEFQTSGTRAMHCEIITKEK